MHNSPFTRVIIALTLLGCAGCGEKPVQRASVQGVVNFEGKPIDEGTIVFVPEKGTRGESVGVPIVAGKYSATIQNGPCVGVNKIQIYAKRKTGRTVVGAFPDTGTGEVKEEYIPPQYNQDSTKTFAVKPGTNQFDYDLPPK